MPDHLHWLFQLGTGLSLSDVVKALKARSAHQINKVLTRQGVVWQKAFHDHAIRREEDLRHHGRYLVANPLRKRIVTEIGCYPLWDAVWITDD
jgi:REP element-mobilizing transposase RayT